MIKFETHRNDAFTRTCFQKDKVAGSFVLVKKVVAYERAIENSDRGKRLYAMRHE